MTRVAIVYHLSSPGGVQSCVLSLIRGLNRIGIKPEILWDTACDRGLIEEAGVTISHRPIRFPIPTKLIGKLPLTIRYLAWIMNPIHGHYFDRDYDFFYIFYNGFLAPRTTPHLYYLCGPPLLPQLQNPPAGFIGAPYRLFRRVYSKVLHQFSPVYEYHRDSEYVIISNYTADLFSEVYKKRLPVVYPPIDLSNRTFDDHDLGYRDSITFFSRIVDYKRPELVLELAKRHPDLRCVIMGGLPSHRNSYFQSLQDLAKSYEIKNVTCLANPSNFVVREELSRTKYYVLPAVNEHFGMTTPEAIASGAIPYVHDSGGQREIVIDDRLRFGDEEYYEKFEVLTQLPVSDLKMIRTKLNKHIASFREEEYIDKMLSYLSMSENKVQIMDSETYPQIPQQP